MIIYNYDKKLNDELKEKAMKAEIKGISYCNHGNNGYSLSIETENNHVCLTSWCYDHRPGSNNTVDMYNLTVDDMYTLANKIIETANKIVSENNLTKVV
jgi:hypothetical protein